MRRIKSRPTLIRNQHFRPGMRSLPADHFFLLGRPRRFRRQEPDSRTRSAPASPRMRTTPSSRWAKSWQTPAPHRERIFDRRMHVRGAFHIAEALVDQIRSGLRESRHGSVAGLFRSFQQRLRVLQMRHIAGRAPRNRNILLRVGRCSNRIRRASAIPRTVRAIRAPAPRIPLPPSGGDARQNVELMHPVAVGVAIRRLRANLEWW